MKKSSLLFLVFLVFVAGSWVVSDIIRNNAIVKVLAAPEQALAKRENDALYALQHGEDFDFAELEETYQFIDGRYDTADFRLPSLIRILYDHQDKVPDAALDRMKTSLLGFKYWMDQPGADAMCYWSENHQILFASAEYLIGQFWPDDIFSNDGKSGAEHRDIARARVLAWLEQRWLYGFTEWYSPVYYTEDVAPLANLIDFGDEEVSLKAKIVMDLLLYDVASQSYRGTFISTSGRMYERQKIHGKNASMNPVITGIWGDRYGYDISVNMSQNFTYLKKYQVPEVIKAIGLDDSDVIIKASNGLNLIELQSEGLVGQDDRQIMMQLAMESFTNPEVISNTLAYVDNNNMFANEFLHDLKLLNIGLLRRTGLLPTVSRMLELPTDGVAIQRANTYTYRTQDYMIATAQSYHPGSYGDQHHIWNALLANDVSIFTTHPAKSLAEKGALSASPGYWVGNGRLPHAVQHENIVMVMYKVPDKPSFMEKSIVHFTHAHFPKDAMDEVVIDGRYAFARLDHKYVAFTAKNDLAYADANQVDLIQPGAETYWVFEASTEQNDGSFAAFINRIKSNPVNFAPSQLSYESKHKLMQLSFGGDFIVNGALVETEYQRFDSPYAQAERRPRSITLSHADKSLFLDFYNGIREER
ncbi:hypothetical protein QWY82_13010 [Simiduia curdlanivorans]|uniref:Uncharacterized protein n=1 Tax=Simiduia curdlanivorans TaxID=1492769 RepID=A0ABV8VA80_9GAMM|nr:hypothetical protein [Simiduia curdlanivorans]MDN3639718.1 hypothetical protein [Simiduia curdlanivorans]